MEMLQLSDAKMSNFLATVESIIMVDKWNGETLKNTGKIKLKALGALMI